MPFRHPDRSHDLGTRIEFEVRERLEEAIDYVCLEALVRQRRARALPPPAADDPDARRAYGEHVLALLRLLHRHFAAAPSTEEARKAARGTGGPSDEQGRLIAMQVALARALPDYWQRFETVSQAYLADTGSVTPPEDQSGGESGGLLARLFGRR